MPKASDKTSSNMARWIRRAMDGEEGALKYARMPEESVVVKKALNHPPPTFQILWSDHHYFCVQKDAATRMNMFTLARTSESSMEYLERLAPMKFERPIPAESSTSSREEILESMLPISTELSLTEMPDPEESEEEEETCLEHP